MKKLLAKVESKNPFSTSRRDAEVIPHDEPSKREAARRIAQYSTSLGSSALTEQVLNIEPFTVNAVMEWFDGRRVGLEKLDGVSRIYVRWIMNEPWKN